MKKVENKKKVKGLGKIFKKMEVSGKKRGQQSDSDESDSEMENVGPEDASKGIRKKPRYRQYYVDKKKQLRRMMKAGIPIDDTKMDDEIAKLKKELGV